MKSIDKIIFNALVSRRSVGLPGIGALSVEHTPAKMEGNTMTAPENKVKVREEWPESAVSVVDMIISLGVSAEDAGKNYSEWLSAAKRKDGIEIEGAGIVRKGLFYPSEELNAHLNPAKKHDSSGKKFSRYEKTWLVLIPVMIIILIAGWSIRWYNNSDKHRLETGSYKPGKTAIVQSSETTVTAGTNENGETETPLDSAKTQPANELSAAPATQTAATNAIAGVSYHVVGGVFSKMSNADNFINKFKSVFPDASCQKLDYKNGLIMVSIYSSASEADAISQRDQIAGKLQNQEIWVYKSK